MENKKRLRRLNFGKIIMVILFISMLFSFSFFLESKGYFGIKSKIKDIFISKPEFRISTKECLVEEDDWCVKYNYTNHYEMNLIPPGLERLINSEYKINIDTLSINWLEINCNCWDWTCEKEESCNLVNKGSYCIQYACKELSGGSKYWFVNLIK